MDRAADHAAVSIWCRGYLEGDQELTRGRQVPSEPGVETGFGQARSDPADLLGSSLAPADSREVRTPQGNYLSREFVQIPERDGAVQIL